MTNQELTKAIFWQLIAFSKLEKNPFTEFSTFPVFFEFAKTQGIESTIMVFKILKKHHFLTTSSPVFQTISLTQKAFLMEKKDDVKKLIKKNNKQIYLANQNEKQEEVKRLKNENELLKILCTK